VQDPSSAHQEDFVLDLTPRSRNAASLNKKAEEEVVEAVFIRDSITNEYNAHQMEVVLLGSNTGAFVPPM